MQSSMRQGSLARQPARPMQCASRVPAAPSARAHRPSTTPLPAPVPRGRSQARDVAPRAATSPGVSGDLSADGAKAASTLVLGTAINIASAAVEAYVTPTEGQEFQCCGSNGTTTQFIGSGDFIAKQLHSILKVNIGDVSVSAKTDLFSRPDLYFQVSSGESFARTPTVHNSTHPTFDEPLLLFPNHPRGSTLPTDVAPLTIRVYDDDSSALEKIGAVKTAVERFGMADIGDDYIGSATIELVKDWESMGTTEHKVELKTDKGETIGTMSLKLTPSPLGKEATDAEMDNGEGAAAAEAFAHPQLAMMGGLAEKLQGHVAAASVLQPALAKLAAAPSDDGVQKTAAVALPSALKAAKQDTEPAAAEGAETVSMAEAKERVQQAWASLPKAFPDAFLLEGEPVAYIDSTYDTQVWMHRSERHKQVVISFRGTQPDNMWDWFTDAMLILQQTTKDPITGGLRIVKDIGKDAMADGGITVHQGFYVGYRSVEPQIRQMLAMCTRGEPGWEITTCGHSLGGGLATLCAYDLATSKDVPYPVQAFTFGSPRTGNKAWAEAYDKVVPDTFRFHNTNDAVAQVPWFMGYKHVQYQSRLDSFVDESGAENGLLYMPRDNPVSVFGGAPVSEEIRLKLKARPGLTDRFRILRRRAQLLGSILSGRGAADHDFDEYLQGLASVMYTASSGQKYQEATRDLRDALDSMRRAAQPDKA